MKLDAVKEVARSKGVSEGAVLLGWHVSQGRAVLAKSVTEARIRENLVGVVELGEEELARLARVVEEEGGVKRFIYPPHGVDFGFPDKVGVGKVAPEYKA